MHDPFEADEAGRLPHRLLIIGAVLVAVAVAVLVATSWFNGRTRLAVATPSSSAAMRSAAHHTAGFSQVRFASAWTVEPDSSWGGLCAPGHIALLMHQQGASWALVDGSENHQADTLLFQQCQS